MRYLSFLFVFLLTGCLASSPTKIQVESADYGAKPVFSTEVIKAVIKMQLKDPDSAKIQGITPFKREWYLNPENFNTQFAYAWMSCASVNAKNSYGAYTGYKSYVFFFRGENLVYQQIGLLNSGRILNCT
jgi:hypothetical protein